MRKGVVKAVFFSLGLYSLVLSSISTASELRVGPVDLEHFPDIEAVLEVQGAEARASLPKASDLTLLEDGRPTVSAQSVRSFQETGEGLAIVVAVDVSRTMAGAPIEQTRKALLSLLRDLKSRDQIALVSFADDVLVEAPFGTPADKVRTQINGLKPRGRITELYRALFKSLSLFTPDLPARRRILVISDGRDEGEAYTLDDVIERARSQEIPVDTIGLTRIDAKYLSNLERLAELTGGSYSPATGASDVETLVRKGRERVLATPVARFAVRDLQADGQPHQLGARWNQEGRVLADEIQVTLPYQPSGKVDPEPDRSPLLLWIGGALLLLVAVFAVWKMLSSRRRDTAVRPSPQRASDGPSPQPPSRQGLLGAAVDLPLVAGPGAPIPPTRHDPGAQPVPEPAPPRRPQPVRHKTQIRHEFPSPSAERPAAVLAAEEGDLKGQRFPIQEEPFWIGAAESNHLALEQDQFLSSHHACIRYQDGTLLLYDNHSTNGTYVNGERLTEVPRPLGVGDRIRVGHTTFVVLTS